MYTTHGAFVVAGCLEGVAVLVELGAHGFAESIAVRAVAVAREAEGVTVDGEPHLDEAEDDEAAEDEKVVRPLVVVSGGQKRLGAKAVGRLDDSYELLFPVVADFLFLT